MSDSSLIDPLEAEVIQVTVLTVDQASGSAAFSMIQCRRAIATSVDANDHLIEPPLMTWE